jgi:stress response protein YsnF
VDAPYKPAHPLWLKEEIRIRKKVAWDEKTVEVDLRKEEVEVDDQSVRGGLQGPLAQERI